VSASAGAETDSASRLEIVTAKRDRHMLPEEEAAYFGQHVARPLPATVRPMPGTTGRLRQLVQRQQTVGATWEGSA
jgi:hypothetical protein